MIYIFSFLIFSFFYFFYQLFCKYINLYDYPNENKIHSKKIAPVGGLIIGSTILLNHLIFGFNSDFIPIIYISLLLIIIGVIDDKYNLNANIRLLSQFLCSGILVIYFLKIDTFGNYPILGEITFNKYILFIISTLCIVGLTNAINFMDGVDGLASGLVLIALIQIVLFYYNFLIIDLFILIFIFLLFIFILLNIFDKILFFQKIFLGNAGSFYIGFVLSALMIYYGNQNKNTYHQVMNLWVVAIPVYDFFATSINRLLNKQNPMQSDLMHIHHLLLKSGFKQNNISIIIVSSALILGLIGFSILNFFNALISLISFFIFFILYFNFKLLIIRKIK